jgi:uncharacterized protein YjgD (DUF1641 family)
MMELMKMLSDPEAMASMGQGVNGLSAVLQEIRNAVILQNCISAIGIANQSNVEVETVLTAAQGYASLLTPSPPPSQET